jgi:hypothetical protein
MELEDHRVDKGARAGRVERMMFPAPKTRTETEGLARGSAGVVDGEESLCMPNDEGLYWKSRLSRDSNCIPMSGIIS